MLRLGFGLSLWRSREENKDVLLMAWYRSAINGAGKKFMETLERCGHDLKVWGK